MGLECTWVVIILTFILALLFFSFLGGVFQDRVSLDLSTSQVLGYKSVLLCPLLHKEKDANDYYSQVLELLESFVFLLLPLPGKAVVVGLGVGLWVRYC